MTTGWDRQAVCADEAVEAEAATAAEIVAVSRVNLASYDGDQLMQALIAASIDVVLKSHRLASLRLARRPKAEHDSAIASWGAKHAWRHCASPSVAKLADVIAEFDRRASGSALEADADIEIPPFEVGCDPCTVTIISGDTS